MGLPFDRIDGNHPCPGPWVHKPKSDLDSRRYSETPPLNSYIRSCSGCNGPPGNCSACDRSRLLGHCLPRHRRYAKRQACDALFAWRDDDLRTSESLSGRPLAADGNDRGAEWVAALRIVHRFSLLADSGSLTQSSDWPLEWLSAAAAFRVNLHCMKDQIGS